MNIAEILKDAPKGTKLYSPIFGDVTLCMIHPNGDFPIIVERITGTSESFSSEGKYLICPGTECLLFPSKSMRNWNNFKIGSQFPTTYEECCDRLGLDVKKNSIYGYESSQLKNFQKLLICRDAWWKTDNDWKPDYSNWNVSKYTISNFEGKVLTSMTLNRSNVLIFRTEEIRDKFLKTFKDLIKDCKELI